MARAGSGGRRQGTPGKAYQNRTDLNANYGQSAPGASAASGGMVAPAGQQMAPAWTTPDMVPKLDDPTARPDEPLTHGLDVGPGGGSEVRGVMPSNPAISSLRAAYMRNPTPELRRALAMVATNPAIR